MRPDLPLPLTALHIERVGERIEETPAGPLLDAARAALSTGAVVLGPFGSGKTHLLHTLARDGAGTVVPLRMLDTRCSVHDGLVQLLGHARLDEAARGERALLLDGFDEIDVDADRRPGLFEELVAAVGPRWLLSSRPGHFRTEQAAGDEQVDTLCGPNRCRTLLIEPLPRDVVWQELTALGGERLVESVDGLTDLATSPMLLRVVHAAWPHIQPGRPLQAWGLFDAWIRHTLRSGPGHDDVVERLHELAWDVVQQSSFRPAGIRFDEGLLDRFGIPGGLRTALFTKDVDGRMLFGHRSVLEFLVAGIVAPRLSENQGHGPDALTGFELTEATRAFMVGRITPMPVTIEGGRVRIPRGNFVSGGTRTPDERPLQIRHLAEPFWLMRTPVTNAELDAWLQEHPDDRQDANFLPHWGPERRCPEGRELEPVYGVWPEDADRYAASMGARLPTADEWEKGVRGIDGRTFPWGDHFRPGRAVTAESGAPHPLPVRAFGCHGDAWLFSAVGGVFEYTSSPYRGRPDRGRIVMGGCYTHTAQAARPSLRLSHRLSGHFKAGFRLAFDA